MKLACVVLINLISILAFADAAKPSLIDTKQALACDNLDSATEIHGKTVENFKDFSEGRRN